MAAITTYEALPQPVIQEQDQARFDGLYMAFCRGIDQMGSLQELALLRRGGLGRSVSEHARERMSLWVEVQVGGVSGKVHRVGKSPAVSTVDYAQLLIAKRNDISRELPRGGNVLVHSGVYMSGLPGFISIAPEEFDLRCIVVQMQGALRAYDPINDDPLVRTRLERALDGETFESERAKNRLHGEIYKDVNGGWNGS